MSGGIFPGPRCLAPMREYPRSNGPADPFPVCWRPAGHAPTGHLSRAAYEHELSRSRNRRRRARKMSAAAVTVTA